MTSNVIIAALFAVCLTQVVLFWAIARASARMIKTLAQIPDGIDTLADMHRLHALQIEALREEQQKQAARLDVVHKAYADAPAPF